MKNIKYLMISIIIIFSTYSVFAQGNSEVISVYQGSELIYDDNIGFETHYYLSSDNSHKEIEGKMNRKFCSAPEGVSPFEVIKNYEEAITLKGGTIIHLSRNAYRYKDEETGEWIWFISDLFANGRQKPLERGWAFAQLTKEAEDYVAGKVSTPEYDIYISVAAALIDNSTYYTIVTTLAEPMNMGNVTLNILNEGIAQSGKVAIYDIYFDTGKFIVKEESAQALKIIADFLKENTEKKFLIVGHTDNTGNFNSNIKLSLERANAVINKLIVKYNINKDQLVPYGVGSTCPQMSNGTEDGKARNRRVELVEF